VNVKGASGDFFLAPGHPVLLRTLAQNSRQHDRPNPWRYEKAGSLPRNCQLPLLGPLPGPGLPHLSNDFLQVLGWVIASGYFHNKDESRILGIQRSAQSSPRAAALIVSMDRCLGRLSGVRRYVRAARNAVSYYLGKALSEEILDVLGDDIHRIPREVLKDGSPRQLAVLYRSLLETSGSMKGDKWSTFYPGRDETLADDFQELATRLGSATTKSYVQAVRGWVLALSSRKHYNLKQRRTAVHQASYEGTVWDLLVPSGAILVRRRGRLVTLGACLNQEDRLLSLHAERRARAARHHKPREKGAKTRKDEPLEPAFGMGTLKIRTPG
jgi:hypothetical protein